MFGKVIGAIAYRIVSLFMRRGWAAPIAFYLYPWIYRGSYFALQPQRLRCWLNAVWERRDLPGEIVEVGSFLCGTSIVTSKMLSNTGVRTRYVCCDTFNGFVPAQAKQDVAAGMLSHLQSAFPASIELVRLIVRSQGTTDLELLQGDIVVMPESSLPGRISVCLLDVDLEEPIYVALAKLWPRLIPGGVIMVDDCDDSESWRARHGYQRFCREQGLAQRYEFGLGVLERLANGEPS